MALNLNLFLVVTKSLEVGRAKSVAHRMSLHPPDLALTDNLFSHPRTGQLGLEETVLCMDFLEWMTKPSPPLTLLLFSCVCKGR